MNGRSYMHQNYSYCTWLGTLSLLRAYLRRYVEAYSRRDKSMAVLYEDVYLEVWYTVTRCKFCASRFVTTGQKQ